MKIKIILNEISYINNFDSFFESLIRSYKLSLDYFNKIYKEIAGKHPEWADSVPFNEADTQNDMYYFMETLAEYIGFLENITGSLTARRNDYLKLVSLLKKNIVYQMSLLDPHDDTYKLDSFLKIGSKYKFFKKFIEANIFKSNQLLRIAKFKLD